LLILLRFCLLSIAFVALRSGCFWCETGAGILRLRTGVRIGISRPLADYLRLKPLTLNQRVPGSSPGAPTTRNPAKSGMSDGFRMTGRTASKAKRASYLSAHFSTLRLRRLSAPLRPPVRSGMQGLRRLRQHRLRLRYPLGQFSALRKKVRTLTSSIARR